MSWEDGWSAINLEMPKRVPRTEYSVDWYHWELVAKVTGIPVDKESLAELKKSASRAFVKKWNYDFFWSTLIDHSVFGDMRTKMGHASYAVDGTDVSREVVCPFKTAEEVLAFDPFETLGARDHQTLVRSFEEHYRSQLLPEPLGVRMTGTYVTLISGLIDLFGWDMLLLAAGTDLAGFGEVANRYARWMQQYFNALADADVPCVMVHDDIVWTSGPFLNPDWYREYVFPNYKKYFAPLRDSKKKIMYTSDGNYNAFIDDIAACGMNGFVLEPCTDMQYIAEKYGKTHAFVGNADTRILLLGTRPEIRAEVERCMRIGKGCPGFFMAVGNHIPQNTPIENALYYNEVYEELSKR